jgi:hypothetical protein
MLQADWPSLTLTDTKPVDCSKTALTQPIPSRLPCQVAVGSRIALGKAKVLEGHCFIAFYSLLPRQGQAGMDLAVL